MKLDECPVYELLGSLEIYLSRTRAKTLCLGADWHKEVEKKLAPEFVVRLKHCKDTYVDWMRLFVWLCPTERNVPSFLSWFKSLSAEELEQMYSPYRLANSPVPEDLAVFRDWCSEIMSDWNTQYFATIDFAVFPKLQDDKQDKQRRLGTLPAEKYVEWVSGGLWIQPSSEIEDVVLVPCYHLRPMTLYTKHRTVIIICYPIEMDQERPGDPSTMLLQLTRGLADETRLRILHFLANSPKRFIDIVQFAGLSKSAIHAHLVILRSAGLVRVHVFAHSTERYSLRVDALNLLNSHLQTMLEVSY